MTTQFDDWRNLNGFGAHPTDPAWGAAGTAQPRGAPADPTRWADDSGLPGAREISNIVARQADDMPSEQGLSAFVWAWGQFVDHDLDLTLTGHETAPIPVPVGDADFDPDGFGGMTIGFERSAPVDPLAGTRAYANAVTSFLDASMVYGSSPETSAAIRGDGGKLFMDRVDMPPIGPDGQFMAGDVRAGENVALTSLHTLFAREHNRIVDALADRDPALNDDELFALARRVVEGEVQTITFDAFLPIILGEGAIAAYGGFDASVDPGVMLEFSTAAYRFGHSLLSPTLHRLAEDGGAAAAPLALRDAFFNPAALAETGIAPILRGLGQDMAQTLDPMVIDDVRSFLFGPPGAGGLDLAALNVQRGRDHAMPSYNDMRMAFGLEAKSSFADIATDAGVAASLAAAYTDIGQVDAWVGGLAEDAYGGGIVGELFHVVIRDQFEAIRAGDPYWSQANPLPDAAAGLGLASLADIVVANTDIDSLQSNVFFAYNRQGGDDGRDRLTGDAGRDLLLGEGGADRLRGRDGDDQLEGGAGRDSLHGGRGDDLLLGGDGRDFLRGGRGDDALDGGAGRDSLHGGRGDDLLLGGDGRDFLRGGRGDDVLEGGAGRDMLLGGRGADVFRFEGMFGHDVILDFRPGDILEFVGFELADIEAHGRRCVTLSIEDAGAVRLVGVHADDFDADALIFT